MPAFPRCPTSLRSALLAACLGAAAVTAQAVEMRGFRGISWGDASVKLGEASRVSEVGGVSCYQRDNENLMFGDSSVAHVHFCFKQDRLFLVSIESTQPGRALADEFGRTYGKPTHTSGGRSVWAAHRGQAQAEVSAPTSAGSTLNVYSAGSQRDAVELAVSIIASTKAPRTLAYLAK